MCNSTTKLARWVSLCALLAIIAIFAPTAAWGQCVGNESDALIQQAAGVSFPTSAAVGSTLTAAISTSNATVAGPCQTSVTIRLAAGVPAMTLQVSCKTSGICSGAQFESPAVFTLTSADVNGGLAGLQVNGTGGQCSGVQFTVTATANPGEYDFSPVTNVDMTIGQSCTIGGLSFHVDKTPSFDSGFGLVGLQTNQENEGFGVISASNTNQNIGQPTSGTGPDQTTVLFTCGVKIDKEISCDGGAFVDGATPGPTYVSSNNDGTNGCVGVVGGSGVLYKYGFQNVGNVGLLSCGITDDVLGSITTAQSLAANGTQNSTSPYFNFNSGTAESCMTHHGNNTGTVSCSCDVAPERDAGGAIITRPPVTASDTATHECCGVSVDKQISCDGKAVTDVTKTWVDQGFISSAGPVDAITDTCHAISGNPVNFRYFARNDGSTAATCSFDDHQNGTGGADIFSVAAGGLSLPVSASSVAINGSAVTETCSATFGSLEPNTGSLGCTCSNLAGGTVSVGATDSAQVICDTPSLNLTKVCDPQVSGSNAVHLTASNTGGIVLNSCTITDTYFATSPTCPAPAGAVGTSLTLPTSATNFTLGISGGGSNSVSVDSSVSSLAASACNTAHVDCVVDSTTTHITANANDVCEVTTGCFTRTIGYWATHPDNTAQVLVANGGGVFSCGLDLTTVDSSYLGPFSTSQDLCSNGQDSKGAGASPLQTSLIRQCAGAAINLAASKKAGLGCGTTDGAGSILSVFDSCCGLTSAPSVCSTGGTAIAGNTLASCNSALDAFNNQFDNTNLPSFLQDVAANPKLYCQEDRGDGHMNTGAGRTYKQ